MNQDQSLNQNAGYTWNTDHCTTTNRRDTFNLQPNQQVWQNRRQQFYQQVRQPHQQQLQQNINYQYQQQNPNQFQQQFNPQYNQQQQDQQYNQLDQQLYSQQHSQQYNPQFNQQDQLLYIQQYNQVYSQCSQQQSQQHFPQHNQQEQYAQQSTAHGIARCVGNDSMINGDNSTQYAHHYLTNSTELATSQQIVAAGRYKAGSDMSYDEIMLYFKSLAICHSAQHNVSENLPLSTNALVTNNGKKVTLTEIIAKIILNLVPRRILLSTVSS